MRYRISLDTLSWCNLNPSLKMICPLCIGQIYCHRNATIYQRYSWRGEGFTYIICFDILSTDFDPGDYYELLHWRHNERDGVSNHQPRDCLLNRLFRRRLKIISQLRVTGFCVGNSPVIGQFPAQMASNAENTSIWWRHLDNIVWSAKYVQIHY